jgi:flagellar hook-basal body complex protein FliE
MSIGGIESLGFTPLSIPQLDGGATTSGASGATGAASTGLGSLGGLDSTSGATQGASFGDLVTDGIDRLQSLQSTTDNLAVKAATGDLDAMHHYTIAASESAATTQLTVAVRNKALEAFNEIMRMPV